MSEFANQINNQYLIAPKVAYAISKENMKKRMFAIIAVVLLVITIISLIGWINQLTQYRMNNGLMITFLLGWVLGFTASCVLGGISIVYCLRKTELAVDKEIITATGGIENVFNTWNTQYFLPQGCYVMAPRNLRYLQFVLDSNIKFSLEDHVYPYDIIPRAR